MAVWIKINKEDVSLEEIQFLFENPKNNFDIHFFDGTKGDYFELEIRGFQDGQEREAKKAVLEEIEKIRDVEFSIDDEEQYLRYQDSQDMQDFLSELKERERKENYAYIEKENGEKIDLSKYFQESPHKGDIKIPSIEEKGILKTNARGIFLEKNQLIAIEAPEALWISDEESPLLEKLEAPKCTNLFLTECKNLKVENVKIDKEGSLIMRMGETYYNNNKKISDKNYYDLKDNTTTYLIAPNATEIKLENMPLLEKVYAPNCEIFHCIESYQLKEENLIVDEDCHIYLNDKEIMRDAIIVLHTEDNIRNKNLINKNLINIGLISQKEFAGEDENYSILCSKEEIRNVLSYSKTEQNVKDFIYEKLKSTNWNDFKYNPNNLNIKNKISQIAIDLKGAYAFIEKENGEKIDISKNIRRKYLYQEISELILNREQEEGKLITNVLNIECSNSMITSIEAIEARNIHCENCENLEEIYAPQCTYIYCEEVPLVKEENMELSYDCEIEGLEKKNQLKR